MTEKHDYVLLSSPPQEDINYEKKLIDDTCYPIIKVNDETVIGSLFLFIL